MQASRKKNTNTGYQKKTKLLSTLATYLLLLATTTVKQIVIVVVKDLVGDVSKDSVGVSSY